MEAVPWMPTKSFETPVYAGVLQRVWLTVLLNEQLVVLSRKTLVQQELALLPARKHLPWRLLMEPEQSWLTGVLLKL